MLNSLALHEKLLGIERTFLEASRWFDDIVSSQKFSLAVIKGPYGCGKTLLLDILSSNRVKSFRNIGHDLKIAGRKEFADILSTLKGKVKGNSSVVIFVIEDIDSREDFQILLDSLEFYSSESTSFHFLVTASEDFFIYKWSSLFRSTTFIKIEERSKIHTKLIIENALGELNTKDKIVISQSCDKEPHDLRFLLINTKFYFDTGKIQVVYNKDSNPDLDSSSDNLDILSLKLNSNLPRIYDGCSLVSLYENDCLSEYMERVRERNSSKNLCNYKSKVPKEELKGIHLKKGYRDMRSNVRLEIYSSLEYLMENQLKLGRESDRISELMNYFEEDYILNRLELEGYAFSLSSRSRTTTSGDALGPSAKRRKILGDNFSYRYNEGTSVAVRKRVNHTFFEYL